jgi:hypothetical protein
MPFSCPDVLITTLQYLVHLLRRLDAAEHEFRVEPLCYKLLPSTFAYSRRVHHVQPYRWSGAAASRKDFGHLGKAARICGHGICPHNWPHHDGGLQQRQDICRCASFLLGRVSARGGTQTMTRP